MPTPLHEAKAELFGNLAHPVRVRVLELLLDGPLLVRDLIADTGIEPANMSQHLAVLRRAGLVASERRDGGVYYSLSTTHVAALMRDARSILSSMLLTQSQLLDEVRAAQSQA